MTPMDAHEAALWAVEMAPATLATVFDREERPSLPEQLRAALAAAEYQGRSNAAVARQAGMEPAALSRLLRRDRQHDGEMKSYAAVARALGSRVVAVPRERLVRVAEAAGVDPDDLSVALLDGPTRLSWAERATEALRLHLKLEAVSPPT